MLYRSRLLTFTSIMGWNFQNNWLTFLNQWKNFNALKCMIHLYTGFCYWIGHLYSWLRPVGSRVRRLCGRIRQFCSRICCACTSIRRLGNRIRRLCNGIRRVCFRISRVCTKICHGYNDFKKLTACHEVNDFRHGGWHLRQKKATEASFTCCLASWLTCSRVTTPIANGVAQLWMLQKKL